MRSRVGSDRRGPLSVDARGAPTCSARTTRVARDTGGREAASNPLPRSLNARKTMARTVVIAFLI